MAHGHGNNGKTSGNKMVTKWQHNPHPIMVIKGSGQRWRIRVINLQVSQIPSLAPSTLMFCIVILTGLYRIYFEMYLTTRRSELSQSDMVHCYKEVFRLQVNSKSKQTD